MALSCPFCHVDLSPSARICKGCGLNIATWLGNNPGKTLPGWVGPAAPAAVPAATAPVEDDGHPELAERWPRAGLLFAFAAIQFIMGRYFGDLAAGATGTNAYRAGAYATSALYGALGFGALAGWTMSLWVGFYLYVADSLWHIRVLIVAGGAGRAALTIFSRFVFARLIYRTARNS